MGITYTPVGRAVAVAKGHYPNTDGRHISIKPGETFTVFEGLDKAKWFTVLGPDTPAPVKAQEPVKAPEPDTLAGVAKVERKRKAEAKPPTGDDLV